MDPLACLKSAENAIMDGQEDIASDRLDAYVNWRGIGGHEPTMTGLEPVILETGTMPPVPWTQPGDHFHRELVGRFEAIFGPYLDGRLPDDN